MMSKSPDRDNRIARNRRALLLVTLILPMAAMLYAAAAGQGSKRERRKLATNAASGPSQSDLQAGFARDVAPIVKKYCLGCHKGTSAPAGIALAAYPNAASVLKARSVWERISQNVAGSHMPPTGASQPTQTEREKLAPWI